MVPDGKIPSGRVPFLETMVCHAELFSSSIPLVPLPLVFFFFFFKDLTILFLKYHSNTSRAQNLLKKNLKKIKMKGVGGGEAFQEGWDLTKYYLVRAGCFPRTSPHYMDHIW